MAVIGGGNSSAQSNSGSAFLPNPDLFSQGIAGMYKRDIPGILEFIKKWTPQMEALARQQGGQTVQQDIGQMGQLLGLENANKQQVAQGNLANYQNYEAPLQMAQSQVMDYNARAKDPEFFNTRANTANQLSDLMSGQLTGGELSNIERGLNRQFLQQGTFNVPSNTQQLQAATTYGDAGRNRSLQGVDLAVKAMPGMRTSEVAPISTAARPISDAIAKTDTSSSANTSKMLFTNPVEEALKSFNTGLGIPESSSGSRSVDFSL